MKKSKKYQNDFNKNNIGPAGTFNDNGVSNIDAIGYWTA
jgi:hypothetical protein